MEKTEIRTETPSILLTCDDPSSQVKIGVDDTRITKYVCGFYFHLLFHLLNVPS